MPRIIRQVKAQHLSIVLLDYLNKLYYCSVGIVICLTPTSHIAMASRENKLASAKEKLERFQKKRITGSYSVKETLPMTTSSIAYRGQHPDGSSQHSPGSRPNSRPLSSARGDVDDTHSIGSLMSSVAHDRAVQQLSGDPSSIEANLTSGSSNVYKVNAATSPLFIARIFTFPDILYTLIGSGID